jgi:hypothetical protein
VTVNLTQHLTSSERDWLGVRAYLRENRPGLTKAAAAAYPNIQTMAGTHLLTRSDWEPRRPVPLDDIDIALEPGEEFEHAAKLTEAARQILPRRTDGSQYRTYAEALGEIAAPTLFENRPTYRLLDGDLTAQRPWLRFGHGNYFDGINTGEAAAHEFTAVSQHLIGEQRLRAAIGNPCDPVRRPVNLAISTLTIRHERDRPRATCLLHWRDPSKVGHAGGLYQVVPVGIFQPSGLAAWNVRNDFSLWRGTVRELSEELLGTDEDYDSERGPIDYESWSFAERLSKAMADGTLRVYCLGMGVDPLTFATDLLTVAVFDAPVFDELFGEIALSNAEGQVLQAIRFEPDAIRALTARRPFQAAGEALLELALTHEVIHN